MRRAARIWPNLTQLALILALSSACSSTQLPLDGDSDGLNARARGERPVVLAGTTGAWFVPTTTGTAGAWAPGAAGMTAPWPGRMQPPVAICGNGLVEPPGEGCDKRDLNGATCFSLGYNGGGTLLCNPTTCFYDTTLCRMDVLGPGFAPTDLTDADAGLDDAGQ